MFERILALPEIPRPPDVLQDIEILRELTRAEDSIRRGLTGNRLQQMIDVLSFSQGECALMTTYIGRIRKIEPAVADVGYR